MKSSSIFTETLQGYSTPVVLIDDDPLIGIIWKLKARKNELNFSYFDSPDLFSLEKNKFDKNTLIFIDYLLPSKESGLEFAFRLAQDGFCNLFITTGFPNICEIMPVYIHRVVGKEFPLKTIKSTMNKLKIFA